ncbi:MAG: alpha-mannosidase, partial [Candidatus Aminicenantes bacterium]|nr:alpha-mannosidase [Candidatus Aminicenantes bacterium]
LKKSGYSSYLFCRPDSKECRLPADDFVWIGYDGSKILAHRARHHYNSQKGKAAQRVKKWMTENPEQDTGMLLWGIGDHGGGPSREDLEQLRELIKERSGWNVRHAVPEDYFEVLSQKMDKLPHHTKDLNPWAVGCYTSMALVKQRHRLLENSYFLTEKIVTHAAIQELMDYPKKDLDEALEDLLFCEFHDILPGSCIPQVETHALQRMSHGLEILSRLKTKAFFSLLSGQSQPEEEEFPVFIYNPHPYPVIETIICEFQPAEPNFDWGIVTIPEVKDSHGKIVPCQMEKESSNLSLDWRKRVVFHAELKPAQMNRFSCRMKEGKSALKIRKQDETLMIFKSNTAEIAIN